MKCEHQHCQRTIVVDCLKPEIFDRIRELVRRLAETFSEIGQERLNLLGRLEKIAEMSRV